MGFSFSFDFPSIFRLSMVNVLLFFYDRTAYNLGIRLPGFSSYKLLWLWVSDLAFMSLNFPE